MDLEKLSKKELISLICFGNINPKNFREAERIIKKEPFLMHPRKKSYDHYKKRYDLMSLKEKASLEYSRRVFGEK